MNKSANIKITKTAKAIFDTLVIIFDTDKGMAPNAKEYDKILFETGIKAFKKANKNKKPDSIIIETPNHNSFDRLVCLKVNNDTYTEKDLYELGGKLFTTLDKSSSEKILFVSEAFATNDISENETYAAILAGYKLRSYNFDTYKTDKKTKKAIQTLTLLNDNATAINKIFKIHDNTVEGVFLARNFVNEPPNILYPESFAKRIKNELKPLGVTVEILDDKKMEKLGMGAALAVGKGSERKPRMVIMKWNGDSKSDKVVSFVGKGVTFDTGGISIKPGANMHEMKMDMGGAAAVVGVMKAVALNNVKKNIISIVGLAENMPSHNAYRPGDIITSYAGKTIEVLNTDAEGRLVLADALSYIQTTYKPEIIIDLATLTGAMMVALGHEYCGAFVNDNTMWSALENASTRTGEKLWRMPLDKVWREEMESETADIQNMAKSGRLAGACTAAGFLEHFIEKDSKWAHLDIAGTAWIKSDKSTTPKFGTGYGVRLLEAFLHQI